jgi:hypothetical protein
VVVNTLSRSWWARGSWSTGVVAILLASVAIGANASIVVLLVAFAVAPVVVAFFGGGASSSPRVAQILPVERSNDRRS